MPGTRKLGRKTDHRMAMLKGMATYLLEYGKIETTVTRAKEVSALTDKMVTLGKANTLASRRQAMAFLKKESVVAKLFTEIAPLYADRNGGYTRVLKIGPRPEEARGRQGPGRRLYPHHQEGPPPRRRRRNGHHYDGGCIRRVR